MPRSTLLRTTSRFGFALTFFAFAGLALAAMPVQANLISNGDFETDSDAPSDAPDNWSDTNETSADEAFYTTTGGRNGSAAIGVESSPGNTKWYHTDEPTLTAGVQYKVSGFINISGLQSGDDDVVDVTLTEIKNGPNITHETALDENTNGFESFDFTFTASGNNEGRAQLVYRDNGSGPDSGVTATLDDISLTAVPEPASLALLGLGGLLLLPSRRRR